MSKSSIETTTDISQYLAEKCLELNKQLPEIKKELENTSKILLDLENLSATVESYINHKNENIIKYNEEELKNSLKLLNYDNVIVDKNIDFTKLISIIRDLASPIEEILQEFFNKNFESLNDKEMLTKKLLQDCKKNKIQLNELESLLCNIKSDNENDHLEGTTPYFKDRLIQTPPIRFSIKDVIIKNPRLALMDSKTNRIYSNNTLLPFALCDKNRSINNRSMRNDKMDPISVLKKITRTAKKQASNKSITNEKNLSILASKWKEREEMMYGNLTPTNISSSTIVSECEFEKRQSVFKMNSPARIFTEQIIETTKTTTPDSIIYSRSSRTNSVILVNLIKSPMGQLNPLVEPIPRITLNDDGIEDQVKTDGDQGIKKSLWLDTSIPDINFDDDESINNISDTILIDLVDDSP